jgi:cephalosporin hydroxylase
MGYTWEEIEANKEDIAERFRWLFFYEKDTIDPNTWMGRRIQKNPLDLFIYAEIAYEVKPKVVIETGSFFGGSAIFWADIMKLIHGDDSGKVISIDVNKMEPTDRNVDFIQGSSLDPNIVNTVNSLIGPNDTVLVNLDSLHDMEHVHHEMDIYHNFVTSGSYMIVEDGIINGHPTHLEYGPGPYEACELFLSEHPEFEVDLSRERLIVTANPRGFLRKIGEK